MRILRLFILKRREKHLLIEKKHAENQIRAYHVYLSEVQAKLDKVQLHIVAASAPQALINGPTREHVCGPNVDDTEMA